MRAAVLTEFNKDWQLQTLPDPRPAPGQVLIRIEAVGVNFIELYFRKGTYKATLPFVPGSEAAGTVEKLGPGVTGFEEGDALVAGRGRHQPQPVPVELHRTRQIPDAQSDHADAGFHGSPPFLEKCDKMLSITTSSGSSLELLLSATRL